MLPSKLSLFKESFVSLDSDDTVRASLFSPTAVNGTMSFQSTPMDRNSTLTPMSVVSVQQPVAQLLSKRSSSFTSEGRITPTFDEAQKKGREKGAVSYSAEEHTYLLSGMKIIPNSFNASESLPEWKSLYKLMVEQYYNFNPNFVSSRPSTTLQ
jgi:hypothetical protein